MTIGVVESCTAYCHSIEGSRDGGASEHLSDDGMIRIDTSVV